MFLSENEIKNEDSPKSGNHFDDPSGCPLHDCFFFHCLVALLLLLVPVTATSMPGNTTHLTDTPHSCQLVDLLKETAGLEEGKVLPTHDQRGMGMDTYSYLIR